MTTTADAPVFRRRCTGGCERILPMTEDYFHPANDPPYFRADCKDCFNQKRRGQKRGPKAEDNRARQRARTKAHNRLARMYPTMWRKILTEAHRDQDLPDPDFTKGAT